MKKKITLITSLLLIIALAVTFVGCNKDKTEDTPTTTEKVSTTEPTTKFEAPEIKDEPTTEETTEATTEPTTKKPVYSSNSGSSSGSSSSGSSGSSNTVNNSGRDLLEGETLEDGRIAVVTNANGGGIYLESNFGANTGGMLPADGDVLSDGSVMGDRDGDGDYDADDSALATDPAFQLGRG